MTRSIKTPYDIGAALRNLRRIKQMTGVELGRRAGMSQSRISKIETGFVIVSSKEIDLLLNILESPKTIRQQILSALELNTLAVEPKYRPIVTPFLAVYKMEEETQHLRCFTMNLLPALLQTTAYREAVLRHWQLDPEEFTQRMTETMKRQDLLWDTNHTYHFIIHEAALYTILGSRQTQLQQIDRLDRMSTLKHIKIGIIPLEAGLPITENSNFVLYDTNTLVLPIASQELKSHDARDITEHMKVFSELDKKAYYDEEMQGLLHKCAGGTP